MAITDAPRPPPRKIPPHSEQAVDPSGSPIRSYLHRRQRDEDPPLAAAPSAIIAPRAGEHSRRQVKSRDGKD